MKTFYLVQKLNNQWYKKEIGVFDWKVYVEQQEIIESLSRARLVGFSKFGAYLLDMMSL